MAGGPTRGVVVIFGTRRPELTAETRHGLPGSFVGLSSGVTHYDLQGDADGDTVVLIHGNAAPYVTWDRTIQALTGVGLRVLRYDLFGHGFSDRPRLPIYDRHFYNTQLAELLTSLDISSPVLVVGTSQGGSIGACFTSENPGRVKKLALLAPFFDELPGADGLAFRLLKARPTGELLLLLMSDRKLADISAAVVNVDTTSVLEREVVQQLRFRGKRRAMLANVRGDALRNATDCYLGVKSQGIPVMLTWGTLDQKLPGTSMRRLCDLQPSIEYHELEGAGHLAHYEFSERVNPLLVRFLTSAEAS